MTARPSSTYSEKIERMLERINREYTVTLAQEQIVRDFKNLLDGSVAEMPERPDSIDVIAAYAAQRAAHLAPLVNEEGFEDALIAEADSIAMRIGLKAVREGDARDAYSRGLILGALRLGATGLSFLL